MCFQIQFTVFYREFLHVYSPGILTYSFLVVPCSGFGIRIILAIWEEPGSAFSLSYELIPLPMHSTCSRPSSGFALRTITSACLPLSLSTMGSPASRVTIPSGQMGTEDTLHSEWGYDSAPRLDMGELSSREGKTSIGRCPNQADLHPAGFPHQNVPLIWFCR